ncbi:acyltransferase [Acetobacter fabarum]|uniref:acyltransferase family protein n=1 Tax=Acetobacter fabarum TaxID=483199 RepID=UPI00312B9594
MPNQTIIEIFMFITVSIIIFIFSSKFFSFLDKEEKNRSENLDGLRFFLAIAVAFHHMIFSYYYFNIHIWSVEKYHFNGKLGRFGVAMFFMLSAYLMTKRNIVTVPEIIKFYINRFFRIVPMFYFSSFLCLLTAVIFGHNIDYHSLLDNLFFWFDGGLTSYKPDINSFPNANLINAGVMWTLPWEWFLYISLPIIYIIRDKINNFAVSQTISFVSVYFISRIDYNIACFILCFSLGMTARDILNKIRINNIMNSLIIILCLSLIFLRHSDPLSINDIIIEFILFYCVCCGGDAFGILRMKGAVRLGEISYSIYLVHGISWFYINKIVTPYNLDNYIYLIVLFFTLVISCMISCATFIFIEKPGINFGEKIAQNYVERA